MPEDNGNAWIKNSLLILGAVGAIIGIGTWLSADINILLAFIAGGGWFFVLSLLVLVRRSDTQILRLRDEILQLTSKKETEAQDLRQQIHEWRTIATQDSESLNRFVSKAFPMPKITARRVSSQQPANEPPAHEEDDAQ